MSQDGAFNPIFIEATYEVETGDPGDVVAGGRLAYKIDGLDSEVGITVIHEGVEGREGDLVGGDLAWQISPRNRVVVEAAQTRTAADGRGAAYRLELEYEAPRLAGRAYLREQQAAFGLGQQTALEAGIRKFGIEGAYRTGKDFTVRADLYQQDNRIGGGRRQVVSAELEQSNLVYNLKAGLRAVREDTATDTSRDADQLTFGASRAVTSGRLTLRGDGEVDLGSGQSSEFPNRFILGADYQVMNNVSVMTEQEFTSGAFGDNRSTRVGLRAEPWTGATVNSTLGRQMQENGERLFATTGLLQRWRVNDTWLFDAGIDRVHTLKQDGEINDPSALTFNPLAPQAIGSSTGDFSAIYTGFAYRRDDWEITSRIEMHRGDVADKWNLLAGASRQLADGKIMAGSFSWLTERLSDGAERVMSDARIGLAWRPTGARWIFLNRMDLVFDEQSAGGFDLVGDFDTRTRKLVDNLNANFMPNERDQVSLQLGLKYVVEDIDGDEYDGITALYGIEYRRDLNPRWDLGLRASVLHSFAAGTMRHSTGVSVGHSFRDDVWITLGYNFTGFKDTDFAAAGYTAKGPYLTFRFRVDQDLFKRFMKQGLRAPAGGAVTGRDSTPTI